MPRGFQGESVAQEARGGSRAAVERGRAAASRSFQTSPMEDSSRFQQASRERDDRGSYNPGGIAREALTFDQFMTTTGRSETNPYGNQGFFSRVFGLDPSKIDYTNNFGQNAGESRGIMATLNNRAYNAYLNPVDLSSGFVNPMLDEGSLTRFGRVERDPNLRQGIAGFGLPSMIANLFDRSDLVVPGQPASDARRQDIGILDFETPKNMDELVSSALREQAPRNVDGLSDLETFEPFTTDLDVRNPESYFAGINTRPQETPVTPGFTRPDDAMPTVSEVILGDLQGPPAFIETGRTPVRSVSRGGQPLEEVTGRLDYPGTANDRDAQGVVIAGTMRAPKNVAPGDNQRYVTVDGRLYDRELDEFLPAAPAVQQGIGAGDPGSASLTTRPGSTSPTLDSGDFPIDLITPEFLPGMEDILNAPPRPQVDPRTGRIPGTSGTFDIPPGGFPDPRVSRQQFTPEQVLKANQNNARNRRADQLQKQGMPLGDALRQARIEALRAKLRTGQ